MTDEGTSSEANPGRVLAIHAGHSANCSSVGSVVDFLFLSTAASGALLAAFATLVASSRDEPDEDRETPGRDDEPA